MAASKEFGPNSLEPGSVTLCGKVFAGMIKALKIENPGLSGQPLKTITHLFTRERQTDLDIDKILQREAENAQSYQELKKTPPEVFRERADLPTL